MRLQGGAGAVPGLGFCRVSEPGSAGASAGPELGFVEGWDESLWKRLPLKHRDIKESSSPVPLSSLPPLSCRPFSFQPWEPGALPLGASQSERGRCASLAGPGRD